MAGQTQPGIQTSKSSKATIRTGTDKSIKSAVLSAMRRGTRKVAH